MRDVFSFCTIFHNSFRRHRHSCAFMLYFVRKISVFLSVITKKRKTAFSMRPINNEDSLSKTTCHLLCSCEKNILQHFLTKYMKARLCLCHLLKV